MSNLVNRSRRNHQRNRQSRKVNRNRSTRQICNQQGGNNVEVSIYCNLTLNRRDAASILTRKLTTSELMDAQAYVEQSFKTFKNPIDSSEEVANMLKAATKYNLEQLSSPYKKFHFVINLTMSETDAHQLVNQQIVDKILDDMGQETFSFEQGTDYSGNLLSNDNETYYFDSECELVGGGNPSVPPTPPPPPAQVNETAQTRQIVDVPKKNIKSIQTYYNKKNSCVQKNYNIKTKTGSRYSVNRCVLSYDPNVDDTNNCRWNKPTSRCRKVSRR